MADELIIPVFIIKTGVESIALIVSKPMWSNRKLTKRRNPTHYNYSKSECEVSLALPNH